MEKKRIEWIDSAKCVGIFLVIFNHFMLDYGQDYIKTVIASFHMPLFFVLSGLTLKSRDDSIKTLIHFIGKRILCIMIPYYLWAFIFSSGVSIKNLLCILWASNKSLGSAGSNAVLWFLPCLFFSSILSYLMLILVKSENNYSIKYGVIALGNFIMGGY